MEPDVKNYEKTFPKYPATIKDEKTGWIHGTWMIGNNFRSKHGYYGEYPPSYLDRLYSLFPKAKNVLHLFSGTVEKGRWKKETTIDINPDLKPDIVNDAHKLSEIFSEECFDLILADPPYSEEDAKHYGTCLISRNKVIKEAQIILKTNGIISWLDQVFPMYRKKELTLIGTIGIWRSTNYRFRGLSIFKKEKL